VALTAPLPPDGEIADHVRLHGDGVRTLCITVDDASVAFQDAVVGGARPVAEPPAVEDRSGAVGLAPVGTFGDTQHTFVERAECQGRFLPGYRDESRSSPGAGLEIVDRCGGNVGLARRDGWVSGYDRVFGLAVYQEFDESDTATRPSVLRGKVVRGSGTAASPPSSTNWRRGCPSPRLRSTSTTTTARGAAHRAPQQRHRRDRRPGRAWIPAPDFHPAGGGQARPLLRGAPAQGLSRLRQEELPGPLRVHRARAGGAGQPLRRGQLRPPRR
jgi:hypothetical protein